MLLNLRALQFESSASRQKILFETFTVIMHSLLIIEQFLGKVVLSFRPRFSLEDESTIGVHEPVVGGVHVHHQPAGVVELLSVPQVHNEGLAGGSHGHLQTLVSLH